MKQKTIYYTGIGSRETPEEILTMMEKLGSILAKKGMVLRSGAAKGSDSAFEKGCDSVGGEKEIYLPWKGFNNSTSELYDLEGHAAEEIAWQYHPNIYALSDGARKLIIRNTYQVLGKNCATKSSFVICYTKDGKDSGGTGQAIRIAQDKKIPVFNLYHKEKLSELKEFIKKSFSPE